MEEKKKEKNWTKIPNLLIDISESPENDLTTLQIKIIAYIINKTLRWHDETVTVSNSFLAKRYKVSERHIINLLKELIKRNILINCKKEVTKRNVWKINQDFNTWILSKKDIPEEANQEDHKEVNQEDHKEAHQEDKNRETRKITEEEKEKFTFRYNDDKFKSIEKLSRELKE